MSEKQKLTGGLILAISIVLLLVFVVGQAASAQDFGALLEAVEGMETDLKQLVEQEKQQRSKEIAQLQATVDNLNGSSPSAAPVDLSGIEAQLTKLKLSVEELKLAVGQPPVNDQQIVDLVNEIAVLKAEMAGLETRLEGAQPQLVSTNENDALVQAWLQDRSSLSVNEEPEFGGIEWSGFFDVVSTHQSSAADNTEFGLNQAEIDLTSQLSDRIAIEAAIAYVPNDAFFELGAAFVDIDLFGGGGSHVRPAFRVDHSSVMVGQIDVPFGIDYKVYASPDRKLITTPMAVDLTHDSWNDFGLQFNLKATHGNLVVFGVNGFESSAEVIDEAQSLTLGYEVTEEVNTTPAAAFGGRLGIAPVGFLELGSSFAFGINESDHNEMFLVGADLQVSLASFEFKGEYISHSLNRSIAEETNRGYYLQGSYSFGPAFVVSRYGSFRPQDNQWVGRMSIGGGYALTEGAELRLENIVAENNENNQTIFQLVASF